MALGDSGLLGAAWHQRLELLDQPVAQVVVLGQLSEGQSAIPCGNFAIKNSASALVGCGDEVFGNALANFFWRTPGRPVAEVILLSRKR